MLLGQVGVVLGFKAKALYVLGQHSTKGAILLVRLALFKITLI